MESIRKLEYGQYRRILILLSSIYIIAIFFVQAYFVINTDYAHEQFRTLFAYHSYTGEALFPGDYIRSYMAALSQPYLYDLTTRFWLLAGGELTAWHRLVPLVCWLVFIAGVAVAARRLGDRVTMLGAVGIAIAQPIYLYQITSALPHAFGFPLLIWALVALLRGSARGLAIIVLLSGLFYPAVTPIVGLLLAWHVLVTQRALNAQSTVRLKSLLMVGITGVVSVWLVFGALAGPEDFGAPLDPTQNAEIYPETGPEGQHSYAVFNPFKHVIGKAIYQMRVSNSLIGLVILLVYCGVSLYGLFWWAKNGAGKKALLAFVFATLACLVLVFALKPFHVYRFVLYPAFTVLPLLFAIGVQQFCRSSKRIGRYPNAATIGLLALFVLAFDSFDYKKMGYWWHLGPEIRKVMAFAADQPPDALFAVWPTDENALELIPYLARRPLFVMRKAHHPTYEKHILAMRERTYALIEAYLATNDTALRKLRCRWGVDYLIANKEHFGHEDARPSYFAPFDGRIEKLWRGNRIEHFVLRKPDARSVALETENYFVVSLKAVDDAASGQATPHCG